MVADLHERGIRDTAVLQAMNTVPREQFVPAEFQEHAYANSPPPLTIASKLSPSRLLLPSCYLSLKLQPHFNVLEIGTGSGYAAAVLSLLVRQVHTVERQERLVAYAQERLKSCWLCEYFCASWGWHARLARGGSL